MVCTSLESGAGCGCGGSKGPDVETKLSGVGVDGLGVGLVEGAFVVSAARLVDSDPDFLGAVDFFFFAMTARIRRK